MAVLHIRYQAVSDRADPLSCTLKAYPDNLLTQGRSASAFVFSLPTMCDVDRRCADKAEPDGFSEGRKTMIILLGLLLVSSCGVLYLLYEVIKQQGRLLLRLDGIEERMGLRAPVGAQ